MIKSKKGNKPTNRVRTAVFAVILAIAAWFLINIVDDPETTVTIADADVRFKNEYALKGQGVVLTGKNSIPSMSVTLRGRRSSLMNYMNDIYIEADTAQISAPGEYELQGTVIVPSNSGISVEAARTGEITVTAEKLESREIPVKISHTGTSKTKIVKSEASSPTVAVTGAKGELDEVASAVASVDVSDMTEDNTLSVGFLLVDKDGNYITQNETLETATAEISVTNTIYTAKNITVIPELAPSLSEQYVLDKSDTSVTPSTVSAGIENGASADSIVLYIDKVTELQQEYTLQSTDTIYIPEENAAVKVRASILKRAEKVVTVTPTVENLASGLSAVVSPVSAVLSGPEEKLEANTVKASVDASGLGAGTYSLNVKFADETITAQGSCTANVTIQ